MVILRLVDLALANLDTLNTGSSSHGTYYMAGLAYWANTSRIFAVDKPVRVKSFSIDVDEGGNGSIEDTGTSRHQTAKQSVISGSQVRRFP